jgi:hypothetical protein
VALVTLWAALGVVQTANGLAPRLCLSGAAAGSMRAWTWICGGLIVGCSRAQDCITLGLPCLREMERGKLEETNSSSE